MPLKHFQAIRKDLYFVCNSQENQYLDRYQKIKPIIEIIRSKFLSVEEKGKCNDEMMVPYKGTGAGRKTIITRDCKCTKC